MDPGTENQTKRVFPGVLIAILVKQGASAKLLMFLAAVDRASRAEVENLLEPPRSDVALLTMWVCRLWWEGHHEEAVDALIDELKRTNPDTTESQLRKGLVWHENGDIDHWDLTSLGLSRLPASFPVIRVVGNLNLSYNNLTTLPWSFGMITVDGDLFLTHNQLTTLPYSFRKLNVNQLDLSYNNLTTLPKWCTQVTVRENLILSDNPFDGLPTFTEIDGIPCLSGFPFNSVPSNFENVTGRVSLRVLNPFTEEWVELKMCPNSGDEY